jgi:uncharacterized protein YndB with AHSA1/START domain
MKTPSVLHDTFVIERTYQKRPDKVFAFFSDPPKKRRWLGGDDDGFEVLAFEPNFKVDHYERWKYRFRGGVLTRTDICYQDIVPEHRIVFVYTMTSGDKRVSSSQVTVELTASGSGTRLRHTEQGAFFDGAQPPAGREQGTGGLLDLLGKLLEEEASL